MHIVIDGLVNVFRKLFHLQLNVSRDHWKNSPLKSVGAIREMFPHENNKISYQSLITNLLSPFPLVKTQNENQVRNLWSDKQKHFCLLLTVSHLYFKTCWIQYIFIKEFSCKLFLFVIQFSKWTRHLSYILWQSPLWESSGIFIVNFEHISHFCLLFLLLNLNK